MKFARLLFGVAVVLETVLEVQVRLHQGRPGNPGYSQFPGDSGYHGYPGDSGYHGFPGNTGFQAPDEPQGPKAYTLSGFNSGKPGVISIQTLNAAKPDISWTILGPDKNWKGKTIQLSEGATDGGLNYHISKTIKTGSAWTTKMLITSVSDSDLGYKTFNLDATSSDLTDQYRISILADPPPTPPPCPSMPVPVVDTYPFVASSIVSVGLNIFLFIAVVVQCYTRNEDPAVHKAKKEAIELQNAAYFAEVQAAILAGKPPPRRRLGPYNLV